MPDWFFALTGTLVFLWMLPKLLKALRANAAPPTATVARIRSEGRYAGEVVGESFYRDNFLKLLGARAGTEDEMHGDALLVLEDDNPHDNQAVGVYVEGLKVGHLPRALARDFRAAIVRDKLTAHRQFGVAVRVYGGGADQLFSAQVDLPVR